MNKDEQKKRLLEIEGRRQALAYACSVAAQQTRQSRDVLFLAQVEHLSASLGRPSRRKFAY